MISKIKKFITGIRPEEWLGLAVALVATGLNVFVYDQAVRPAAALRAMVNYFTFGEPFYGYFFLAVYCLALFGFYRCLAQIMQKWVSQKVAPNSIELKESFFCLLTPLRAIVPIGLAAVPMYQLLAHFSYALRHSGKDIILATADQNFLGGLLFVYLPTHFSTEWFVWLMYYGYLSLPVAISGLLVWLFLLKKERLLRLATTAFVLSFVLAYPLFYKMPCQDPAHFFIANNRQNIFPEQINRELALYQPSVLTTDIINKIGLAETIVAKDNTVPISCFPSMHAVWFLIVIYFLARINRFTILLSIPWFVINLAGGLYFAQHYLVDYIVAIPVAMLSVGLAYWLCLVRGSNPRPSP